MGWTKRSRNIYVAPCENVSSDICGQQRPRSACASAQSDQGLDCPLTEILDTTECMDIEQRSALYFVHAKNDLYSCILRMFEGNFFFMLDTANLRIVLRIRVFSKNYLKYLFSVHSHFVETVLSIAYWYLAKLYSPLFLGIVSLPFSLFKLFEIVVFRSFSVVRDRVIAYWFRDKLALAFGIAVSTMGMGSVLTFLLTSNMAQWIGLTSTLFAGKSCSEILIGFVCCFFDLSILIAEQIIFKEIKDVSSIG